MTKSHFLNLTVQYMLLKLVKCFQKRVNLKITARENIIKNSIQFKELLYMYLPYTDDSTHQSPLDIKIR